MTRKDQPESIDDATLDDISGGPTEELFGAYNFKLLGSAEFIGETEENVWKAPAGVTRSIKSGK